MKAVYLSGGKPNRPVIDTGSMTEDEAKLFAEGVRSAWGRG